MISVLCPTRGRPDSLAHSLHTLHRNAVGRVEYLLAVDRDDTPPDPRRLPSRTTIWRTERHGYAGLHRYYNHLARNASGDWLFLWNDDAEMLTPGWDEIVGRHTPAVLNPATNHGPGLVPFPVVPSVWVARLGHFSLNQHCDSWWQEIGHRLGRLVDVPVEVRHRRADLTGDHDDATFRARVYDPAFYTRPVLGLIDVDAEVLRPMLEVAA